MYKGKLFKGALFAGLLFGSVIAIELPPQVPAGPLQKPTLKLGQKVTVKAFHKLGSTAYDVEIGRLLASSASVATLTGTEFTARFGKLGASAAAKVVLVPVDYRTKLGRLTAEGRIDISDEELAALLMEILDV
jgi:hypothetical protein